jgi:hypothetical protein
MMYPSITCYFGKEFGQFYFFPDTNMKLCGSLGETGNRIHMASAFAAIFDASDDFGSNSVTEFVRIQLRNGVIVVLVGVMDDDEILVLPFIGDVGKALEFFRVLLPNFETILRGECVPMCFRIPHKLIIPSSFCVLEERKENECLLMLDMCCGILHAAASDMEIALMEDRLSEKKDPHLESTQSPDVETTPLTRCACCRKRQAVMKECPCRAASYCSKQCQLRDWGKHKQTCPLALVGIC